MHLKPGLKLSSAASAAQFIVIRAPQDDLPLSCAGAPLVAEPAGQPAADGTPDLLVGKRYTDAAGALELLCTSSGAGPLLMADQPLPVQAAKSLPSSD
ncbi:MAG: hypothetical protein ABR549_07805 [Mycobacteriales bacterium]